MAYSAGFEIGADGARLPGGPVRGFSSVSTPAGGSSSPAGGARRWAAFFIGLAAILVMAFVVIPFINTLPGVKQHIGKIRAYDVDATSLFYTETEEAFEAYNYLRDSEDYSPKR